MRLVAAVSLILTLASAAFAEVTGVTITSRSVVGNGQAFGETGPYEKLVGRIQFALDPAHSRNKNIVDLDLAPRGPDKRVHFSADLLVLQPVDRTKGNGVLLTTSAFTCSRARSIPRRPCLPRAALHSMELPF